MKLTLSLLAALLVPLASLHAAQRVNILFFTSDDMNFDSSGVCGGPIKDLTPNIDRLAAEGLRFQHAYSTVAVCQPVRQIMQTGLYPHRNGALGFFPVKPEVRTLNQQLHDAGYLISMFGKGPHHQPAEKFCVDVGDDKISRHPVATCGGHPEVSEDGPRARPPVFPQRQLLRSAPPVHRHQGS